MKFSRNKTAVAAFATACCVSAAASFGIPALAADFPVQGIYEIRSALDENYVLDEQHCTEYDNESAALQMFSPLRVKQQEFYLEFINGYCCRIINLNSGRYLAQGEETETDEEGASVYLVQYADAEEAEKNDALLWHFIARPDGSFLLRSADGLYLTLAEGRPCKMAALCLKPFNGRFDQHWTFTSAPVYPDGTADTDFVNPYEEGGALYGMKVRIAFEDKQETLTAETLASWMSAAEGAHSYALDEEKLRTYVSGLAEHYNTVGIARNFVTNYKTTITLHNGNFGWKLNEDETYALLKEAVKKPGNRQISPVWSQEGKDYYGTNTDIGDSYVEIDLSAQKVWLFVSGEEILETDCVSGDQAAGRETPGGVYFIYYKQSPAVLSGADYQSPVDYWMPFNGGIGLHDASWRSTFGGDIYKTNGSHGCVNLPHDAAETIYENTQIGFPVVCYR